MLIIIIIIVIIVIIVIIIRPKKLAKVYPITPAIKYVLIRQSQE